MTEAPNPNLRTRVLTYYERNEVRFSIAFFVAGFLFDIITLSEVDDWFSILQQFLYLAIIGGFLFLETKHSQAEWTPHKSLQKIWEYRSLVVHFLLGSLLSVYSLFYFKSSSIVSSFLFMGIIFSLMVANEIQRVQSAGIWVKLVLWILSLISFLSILVPVVIGSVGYIAFFLTLLCTGLILYSIFKQIRKLSLPLEYLKKQVYIPAISTVAGFILFYLLGFIPPVPLSAKFMGIYHNIEKYGDQYHLYHSNPYWKFWNHGDQNFYARPGDKIHFFMNIYSPARFSDSVNIHWLYDNPKTGWETWDRIPVQISGGREEGFRGYTFKSKYAAGDWRIQLETTDGREIGRISFTVYDDPSTEPINLEKDIR